jgi:DNA-binding NarL/FixJ family response regulator
MSEQPITVFLADDHDMVREGLAVLLEANGGIRVVGQTGDGLDVLDSVRRLDPDVAILDVTMPGLNGLDVCRELVRTTDHTVVLVLTMHCDEQFVATALANGASGYVLKESAIDELCRAVHKIAAGEMYLGAGIARGAMLRAIRRGDDRYDTLSTRERQVLQLIAEGKTNRSIAQDLSLAVKTVDTHRCRLMRKLDIHDQTSLVKFALRKGIIELT